MRDPQLLIELYWYIYVVELGSFSAVAQQTGIAKSSLSRRIKNLETRLGVQLLSRGPRKFLMTTVGEEVYSNALEMIAAAHAAKTSAEEAREEPGGLIKITVPAVLSGYLISQLKHFKNRYPGVRFELYYEHEITSKSNIHFDLSFTLEAAPTNSSEIVVRPIANLCQAFLASPEVAAQLTEKTTIAEVEDSQLLVLGQGSTPTPLYLQSGVRQVNKPSLVSSNLQTLKDAAKAGLGIACLPIVGCEAELASNQLQTVCVHDRPMPMLLTSQTPPFKGITPTTRQLIKTIAAGLEGYAEPN